MTNKKGHIRIAFVGLGERGRTALKLMLPIKEAEVTALCDVLPVMWNLHDRYCQMEHKSPAPMVLKHTKTSVPKIM